MPLATCLIAATGMAGIFLFDYGFKRWITAPQVFERYQFAWDRVIGIPPDRLAATPNGDAIGID
jgi:hypothetical protein